MIFLLFFNTFFLLKDILKFLLFSVLIMDILKKKKFSSIIPNAIIEEIFFFKSHI